MDEALPERPMICVWLMALVPHGMAAFWWFAERQRLSFLAFRIYAQDWSGEQAKRELRNSAFLPLHSLVAYLAMPYLRGTGTFVFAYSLLLTYAWAEVWHYYSHRAMHSRSLHWIHKEHHKSRVCSPFTALSFSLTEKLLFSLGLFSVPLVVAQVMPVSFAGVGTWYVGYLVINSFAHANFELRSTTSEFGTSTTYHALHHSRYLRHFGLGTRVLDKAHETEWSDYEGVFQRARQRLPLARLNDRVERVPSGASASHLPCQLSSSGAGPTRRRSSLGVRLR
jgi:Delta7-sterol 5-desaturase